MKTGGMPRFIVIRQKLTIICGLSCITITIPSEVMTHENWWDAKVYRNKTEADYNLWSFMYYNHNPFRGDDGWHEKQISEGYRVKGIMTSTGQCKLQLKIWKPESLQT